MATNFTPSQSRINKAFARLKMILTEFFEKWHTFSFALAVYNTLWWIANYSGWVKLHFYAQKKITHWTDKHVIHYYIGENQQLTTPHTRTNTTLIISPRIWVFWWQGTENMPQLVQGCFRQLTTYNDNVCLITKDNHNKYCHIPDYILQKLYRQEISITHFSDILRVSLLAENGGLWLDATCWVAKKIPNQIYNLTFFSPRTKNLPDMPLWSNSRWCTWAMGTNEKNNRLFCFMRDVFYAVCKNYKNWPFYLFLDYCYDFAYRNYPEVKTMIDANPENNIHRNDLHFMLNKPFNKEEYENLCNNNWLFKLSYKTSWKSLTSNGTQTYYGRLIENLR